MPNINGGEFLILLIVAVFIVGPERLPRYAQQLGTWARALRDMFTQAKDRVTEELGEEAKEVDWATLDPRQYDPRKIVRDALLEPPGASPGKARTVTAGTGAAGAAGAAATAGAAAGAAASSTGSGGVAGGEAAPEATAPFDDEAT